MEILTIILGKDGLNVQKSQYIYGQKQISSMLNGLTDMHTRVSYSSIRLLWDKK